MRLRVGFITFAHLHAPAYLHALRAHPMAEVVGICDDDGTRAAFSGLPVFESLSALLGAVDAVVIVSENLRHAAHIEAAAAAGKAILCEKPLAASREQAERIGRAVQEAHSFLMTAFPCRYSPAFGRMRERLKAGDIGTLLAVCATNRGKCPGGWFVDPALSGGGAMIDHTVHVADLLWLLLGEEPTRVAAQIGSNRLGLAVEDSAMLTLDYASDIFATLDSSWSRPESYRTWGDVTMSLVGDAGVLEVDLFGQEIETFTAGHLSAGYGSDLDSLLIDDFVRCVLESKPSPITAEDGLRATRVVLAGYESASNGGRSIPLGGATAAR